jgi:hypothetical protein
MRFASAVADFGSPFYAEERQRDVWNEASAFGFQLMLWATMALSAAMFWLGGRPVAPYAFAVLLVNLIASYLVIAYARLLGVKVAVKGTLTRPRMLVSAVVYFALVLGAVRSVGAHGLDGSGLMIGLMVGAGGMTGLIIGMRRDRRRRERSAQQGEPNDVGRPGL